MKRLFCLLVLLLPSFSHASSLLWDPPDKGTVTGYKIYYWDTGEVTIPMENEIELKILIDNPRVGISQDISEKINRVDDIEKTFHLPSGKSIGFTVTAYNTEGESQGCKPVICIVPNKSVYKPASQRDIFEPPPEPIFPPKSPTAEIKE